jgi:hypothetical protein
MEQFTNFKTFSEVMADAPVSETVQKAVDEQAALWKWLMEAPELRLPAYAAATEQQD